MKKVKGLGWTHTPEVGDAITYHSLVVASISFSGRSRLYEGWANGHGLLAVGTDLEVVRAILLGHVTEIAIKNGAEPGE